MKQLWQNERTVYVACRSLFRCCEKTHTARLLLFSVCWILHCVQKSHASSSVTMTTLFTKYVCWFCSWWWWWWWWWKCVKGCFQIPLCFSCVSWIVLGFFLGGGGEVGMVGEGGRLKRLGEGWVWGVYLFCFVCVCVCNVSKDSNQFHSFQSSPCVCFCPCVF